MTTWTEVTTYKFTLMQHSLFMKKDDILMTILQDITCYFTSTQHIIFYIKLNMDFEESKLRCEHMKVFQFAVKRFQLTIMFRCQSRNRNVTYKSNK